MSSLPLSDIVNISVQVSPTTSVLQGFNTGLIVGPSTIISPTTRVQTYSSLDDMAAAGFSSADPEYNAASLYFSQTPAPQQLVVGRWDSGSESAVAAVTACRAASTIWYACTVCGAADSDILALAQYIETASPLSVYFATTADAAVLSGTAGNTALTLQGAGYKRTLLQYSTTTDAAAAIMGYAMGANTQTVNSAYTLFAKTEVGVTPENLTESNLTTLRGQNCNYYINRGNTYKLFETGIQVGGFFFDQILGLDILVNNIQTNVMTLLTSVPKVPLTQDGVAILVNVIAGPCQQAFTAGFLGAGTWTASGITVGSMTLNTGDMLESGYKVMPASMSTLTQAQRIARQAPQIIVPVKLAGAVQNVVINIVVNS